MLDAYIYDGARTPTGRPAGGLAPGRPDDLLAGVLRELIGRAPFKPGDIEDVVVGNTNQAGEDARNVARHAALLAGLPTTVPGITVNRLCASGLAAVLDSARAASTGEGELFIAGGVESMSRAPFVMAKSEQPYQREFKMFDSTIGTRAAGEKHGMKPIARILAGAVAGVDPRVMGLGPVPAGQKALERAGLTLKDLDLIEINEAFAAQVLGCLKGFGLPLDDSRVNPNGGAIAIGHPLGASGARLALTAARQLQATGGRYGLVSLCIGVRP